MKVLRAYCIYVAFIIALWPASSPAGWSEDMRLTTRGHEIHPQVIARNDTVHVAWEQMGDSNQVSYIRSIESGYNWEEVENLVDFGHLGARAVLSLSLENALVTWSDADTISPNPFPNVGYVISEGGEYWPPPEYVFPPRFQGLMDLATTLYGDSIYVAYYADYRDSTGYFPLRFLYSSDLGQSWSEELTIAHCPEFNNNLRMARCYNTIYVFWAGDPIPIVGHPEILGVVSHDGGQSWSEEIQLSSEDYHSSQRTCLACDEVTGRFAVGWMDSGYPGDLYLRMTTDGGYDWGEELHATQHGMVASPSIAVAGDTIWAVWSDKDPSYGGQNDEISFSKSTDQGFTWSPHERITFADGWSYVPWISYDNGKLHLVWWEYRRPPHEGNEIYYKLYTPDPTATFEDRSVLPGALSMSAYPNPFNSSVTVSLSSSLSSQLLIYDLLGRIVQKYSLTPGSHKIVWTGVDLSGKAVRSGVYFARLKTSKSLRSTKMVLLK
ncbi:MAG: T9SS type A sorting domain-containing protein [candidate division Zixibacteria bacterium]